MCASVEKVMNENLGVYCFFCQWLILVVRIPSYPQYLPGLHKPVVWRELDKTFSCHEVFCKSFGLHTHGGIEIVFVVLLYNRIDLLERLCCGWLLCLDLVGKPHAYA